MYLSLTTSPAMVMVSPLMGSAFLTFQISWPVSALQRDDLAVERAEEDLAVGVVHAAMDHRRHARPVLPALAAATSW